MWQKLNTIIKREFKLQQKIAALFIFIILALLETYSTISFYNLSYEDNAVYHQISKQNTLYFQQAVFYLQNVIEGNEESYEILLQQIERIETNLKILKEGGTYEDGNSRIKVNAEQEFSSILADVSTIWHNIKSDIDLIMVDLGKNGERKSRGNRLQEERQRHIQGKYKAILKQEVKLVSFNELLTESYYFSFKKQREQIQYFITIQILAIIGLAFVAYFLVVKRIINPIQKIVARVGDLSQGETIRIMKHKSQDEIGTLIQNINTLSESFEQVSTFATEIGKGNLDSPFRPRSERDALGKALMSMRESLKKVAENDRQRNWANTNLAHFSNVLRQNNDNLQEFAYEVLANLVKVLGANQGSFFMLSEHSNEDLTLTATYAYDHRKYDQQEYKIKQSGLLGQAFLEGNTLHITEIPQNYVHITSGLGEATPNALLIIPLKHSAKTFGVVEIATFGEFATYQLEFIDILTEIIAATLYDIKNDQKVQALLDESNVYLEQMRAQEEEMKQNMGMLVSTQEEAHRSRGKALAKEARIAAVLDNAKEQIFSIDRNYGLLVANQAFVDFCESRKVSLRLGTPMDSVWDMVEWKKWQVWFDNSLKGEWQIFQLQEQENWFDYSFYPIFEEKNKEVTGVCVYIRNINHLKKS